MKTVVVTIAGPERRVELAVPAETPIEQLMPTFAALGVTDEQPLGGDPVGLAPAGGRPLPLTSTLAECGVTDGALLEVQLEQRAGFPLKRTEVALPDSPSFGGRLKASVSAFRSDEPSETAGKAWRSTSYLRRLDEQIVAPRLKRGATVAVVSPKNGVGTTTVALLLASLLARVRSERVETVGTDPGYTKVFEGKPAAARSRVLDCGTRLGEPIAEAAGQIVLVTDAEPSNTSVVAEAAQPLRRAGRPIFLIVNKLPRKGARLDLEMLSRAVPDARALIRVSAEPESAVALAAGDWSWDDAPPAWQISMRELAAVMVADWPGLGLAT